MASSYGKKSFGQSIKSAFGTAVKIGVVGAAAAGPLYYEYGTIEEHQQVTIKAIDRVLIEQPVADAAPAPVKAQPAADKPADDKDAKATKATKATKAEEAASPAAPVQVPAVASTPVYEYTIKTDKGVFKNRDSYPHIKFNSEDIQEELVVGQTYNIKTYGRRFALPVKSWSFYPNILKVQEVTKAQPKTQQASLSGDLTTYTVKVGDTEFLVTVPVEVKDKVTVVKAPSSSAAPLTVVAPRPSNP